MSYFGILDDDADAVLEYLRGLQPYRYNPNAYGIDKAGDAATSDYIAQMQRERQQLGAMGAPQIGSPQMMVALQNQALGGGISAGVGQLWNNRRQGNQLQMDIARSAGGGRYGQLEATNAARAGIERGDAQAAYQAQMLGAQEQQAALDQYLKQGLAQAATTQRQMELGQQGQLGYLKAQDAEMAGFGEARMGFAEAQAKENARQEALKAGIVQNQEIASAQSTAAAYSGGGSLLSSFIQSQRKKGNL